jgi:spore germination protein PF
MKIKRVRIMPIVINHVVIPNVTGGVVTFGDTYYVSPKSNSKTAQGSGSSNTGICVNTNSGLQIRSIRMVLTKPALETAKERDILLFFLHAFSVFVLSAFYAFICTSNWICRVT